METLMTVVYVSGLLAAPIAGYLLVARKPDASRLQMLGGSTLGGAVFGVFMAILALVAMNVSGVTAPDGFDVLFALYFIVTSIVAGVAVGALGLAARAVGAWLAKRS